jgi:lipoprotein-anchoring transpeptidase ErfK/SrfK
MVLVAAAESLAQEQTRAAKDTEPGSASRRIVVRIPDRKLALIENGRVVKVFPVAVGAPGTPSPSGEFRVANRIEKPTYYAPGKVIKPGPANPLGTRWIGLSLKGLGIHGTNEPISIGRRSSHGCIRMRNEDVEELFELVRAGDVVELHRARTEQVAQIFAAPQAPAPLPAQAPAAAPVFVAAAVVR